MTATRTVVTRADCEDSLVRLNRMIRSHGGQVEIVSFDETNRKLVVRLIGLCTSCPAWPMTLHATIRPYFAEELGLDDVEIADRRISEAATRRIEKAFGARGVMSNTPAGRTMLPRLPALERSDLDERGQALFDDIAVTRGGMPTSFKVFLNSPAAASAISDFGKHVRFTSRLPNRILELVIMRVAAVTGDRYMWAHHAELAAAAMITRQELEALRQEGAFSGSDPLTRRVVAFVDAELQHVMNDYVFDAVRADFGNELTLELAISTAYYAMQHTLFSALRLDSDVDTRIPLAKERARDGGRR